MPVAVVFDIESQPPVPIGTYIRSDEDAVIYATPAGTFSQAPAECVTVVEVDPMAGRTPTAELIRTAGDRHADPGVREAALSELERRGDRGENDARKAMGWPAW